MTSCRETSHHNFDHLRNPLIYLEDLARSHGSGGGGADSDSEERSGKSRSSGKEEEGEEKGTPALLSRPDNFNPFTPKT